MRKTYNFKNGCKVTSDTFTKPNGESEVRWVIYKPDGTWCSTDGWEKAMKIVKSID